jgi:hypothetical protein
MASRPTRFETARHLSIAVAITMATSAAWGLVDGGLYKDNALVTAGWRGNDLITLAAVTPLLLTALSAARLGSLRGQLLWLGTLDYALYNSAFYLFGSAFNAAFLLYVATFTFAIFALVFGLAAVDADSLRHHLSPRLPRRAVAGVLVVIALALGGFHVGVALQSALSGQRPALLEMLGHPTNVVAALDLSLVVSVSLMTAWWLWRGDVWGVVLAAVTLAKGALYMLALSTATLATVCLGAATDLVQVWLWASIGLVCAVAAVLVFRHIASRPPPRPTRPVVTV